MTGHKPKVYFYSRLFIYGLVALILIWIAVSMFLSVGYSVFWEHKRELAIPEVEFLVINDPKQALKALKGIELFHKELLFNVRRFTTRYRFTPKTSYLMWNRWQVDWRKDFDELGRRYSFTRPPEMLNVYERRLNLSYKRIKELESSYSEKVGELYRLFEKEQRDIKTFLKNNKEDFIREIKRQ